MVTTIMDRSTGIFKYIFSTDYKREYFKLRTDNSTVKHVTLHITLQKI